MSLDTEAISQFNLFYGFCLGRLKVAALKVVALLGMDGWMLRVTTL